ncbi:MAG: damage-control phosphatase ARMT1 family protein [Reichenbachiella sp.]
MFKESPFLHITEGSFADMTFKIRYPKILQDVVDSSLFEESINQRLLQLKNGLQSSIVSTLIGTNNTLWQEFYSKYEGKRIIDTPFFFAEVYFFALIRDITGYAKNTLDPFSKIKETDLNKSQAFINETLLLSNNWQTSEFIRFALEGNKSDLSQLKDGSVLKLQLLIDHTAQLIAAISKADAVHIIQDNAGVELFSDLLLANHIVSNYRCKIILHIKTSPIFVSDTIQEDIDQLLSTVNDSKSKELILDNIKNKRIEIKTNPFWVAPKHFTTWQGELALGEHDIIISKGDANYRRFFEDRQFSPSTTSQALTSYLTHSTFCIRTLKSEIQTNIPPSELIKLNQTHGNWMTNGEFAVIQHLNPE